MTSLPVDDLCTLRLHDVLLLDVSAFVPDRKGLVRVPPTAAWRVTVEADAVVLNELCPAVPVPDHPAPAAEVICEVGRVAIPCGHIGVLAAGERIPLLDGGRAVLRVNGVLLAAGELVQIGKRLGVRLLDAPAALTS